VTNIFGAGLGLCVCVCVNLKYTIILMVCGVEQDKGLIQVPPLLVIFVKIWIN